MVGRQGRDGKCVLTLYFRRLHFQLYMLPLRRWHARSTSSRSYAGTCSRGCLRRCSLHFCDPQQSYRKAACEKNHVELRRIPPRGRTDFDALTGRDMARCMSYANSYRRKSIGWFASVDMALAVLPRDLIDDLGIERIEPARVNLTPIWFRARRRRSSRVGASL